MQIFIESVCKINYNVRHFVFLMLVPSALAHRSRSIKMLMLQNGACEALIRASRHSNWQIFQPDDIFELDFEENLLIDTPENFETLDDFA